jgi:elongation factor P
MADVQATELRKGMAIVLDGVLRRVPAFAHRTPGNKRGFVQTTLRSLIDGTQKQVKFGATDMVERAHVETREMEFLYSDGTGCVFMDTETYEQTTLQPQVLGGTEKWLIEGMRALVEMYGDNPIGVQLPKGVDAVVAETEPVVKGQTAAKSNKPAKLENGVVVQVPPFIEVGERIRVDPYEDRYIERAK